MVHSHRTQQESVVVARKMPLETAHRLDTALALGFLAGDIGARGGVDSAACDCDDVQCAVELVVAAAMEAVAVASPRGCGNRSDAPILAKCASLAKRSAPAVCPIRIAAQSGPQPVSASSSGRCTRTRSRTRSYTRYARRAGSERLPSRARNRRPRRLPYRVQLRDPREQFSSCKRRHVLRQQSRGARCGFPRRIQPGT